MALAFFDSFHYRTCHLPQVIVPGNEERKPSTSHRFLFLSRIIRNLEIGESVPQSLMLMQLILKTFPLPKSSNWLK